MKPKNELGVIVNFAKEAHRGRWEILEIGPRFPDAVLRRNGQQLRAEFEYMASSFVKHEHNQLDCDLVICWANDCPSLVLPVLEVSRPEWWKRDVVILNRQEKQIALQKVGQPPKKKQKRKASTIEKKITTAKKKIDDLEHELIGARVQTMNEQKAKQSERTKTKIRPPRPEHVKRQSHIRLQYSDCESFDWCKANIGIGCQGCNCYEPVGGWNGHA